VKPVRWGVLSTALIGTQRAIPGLRNSAALEVAAMALRDNVTESAARAGSCAR